VKSATSCCRGGSPTEFRRNDNGQPHPLADAPDDLARQLRLHAEWRQLIRKDPRLPAEHLPAEHLPAEHLPAGWPAIHAERLFGQLAAAYEEPAKAIAAELLDTIEVDPPVP
jgi:phenylacetic acid degradation operon negative regulatory protein